MLITLPVFEHVSFNIHFVVISGMMIHAGVVRDENLRTYDTPETY